MKHEGCVSFRTTWWRQMTNVCAYYLQGKMLLKTNEGLLVWTRKLSHKQLILVFSKHFRLIFFLILLVCLQSRLHTEPWFCNWGAHWAWCALFSYQSLQNNSLTILLYQKSYVFFWILDAEITGRSPFIGRCPPQKNLGPNVFLGWYENNTSYRLKWTKWFLPRFIICLLC